MLRSPLSPARLLGLGALFVSVGLLAGCASGGLTFYPASTQDAAIEKTTRQGYTFLRSTKGQTTVTVSLRGATDSYVQSYASIVNDGSSAVTVNPSDIRVVALGPQSQTFSAYAPGEVPGVVERAALSSRKSVMEMSQLSVTSSAVYGAEEGRGSGNTGGYGSSGGTSDRSYMDYMLREKTLTPNNVASGLVYTPFNRNVEGFRMEIPVGSKTHVFRFTVQSASE
jgi:hypothetical protein